MTTSTSSCVWSHRADRANVEVVTHSNFGGLMIPLRSLVTLGSALSMAACAGSSIRWQPSFSSQVPDSATVRFTVHAGEAPIAGSALDWQLGHPRVVTVRGDTVRIPERSALEVRLKEKATHATAGAIIGWALSVAISYAACPPPKRYCGEEDPTPLIATGLGVLIGSRIRTDWWVAVQWAPAPPDSTSQRLGDRLLRQRSHDAIAGFVRMDSVARQITP